MPFFIGIHKTIVGGKKQKIVKVVRALPGRDDIGVALHMSGFKESGLDMSPCEALLEQQSDRWHNSDTERRIRTALGS